MNLTELINKYLEIIGPKYHKDKDFHFYIERAYSYGEEPRYQFIYHGYRNDIREYLCSKDGEMPLRRTEKEAERDMEAFLEWAIRCEQDLNE